MPLHPDASCRYAIDPESGLALCVSSGTLTGEDMLALVEGLHANPLWQPEYDAIWDCQAVEAHIVLPEEVKPIVDEVVDETCGRDVMLEPSTIGGALISELLAVRSRLRGKHVTVQKTLADALATLGHAQLPDALADLYAGEYSATYQK